MYMFMHPLRQRGDEYQLIRCFLLVINGDIICKNVTIYCNNVAMETLEPQMAHTFKGLAYN